MSKNAGKYAVEMLMEQLERKLELDIKRFHLVQLLFEKRVFILLVKGLLGKIFYSFREFCLKYR